MNDIEIVKKFTKMFSNVKEEEFIGYWEDYNKYEAKLWHKFLIVSADKIFGIIKQEKAEELDVLRESWKGYNLIRTLKVKKAEMGKLLFGEYIYGLFFLIDCIRFFGSQTEFEIKTIRANDVSVLCIKINEKYSFGFSEIINYTEYAIQDDGVWFVDETYDDKTDSYEVIEKVFGKWVNDRAVGKLNRYNKYLYNKNYFFEEVEEQGGFLMV